MVRCVGTTERAARAARVRRLSRPLTVAEKDNLAKNWNFCNILIGRYLS